MTRKTLAVAVESAVASVAPRANEIVFSPQQLERVAEIIALDASDGSSIWAYIRDTVLPDFPTAAMQRKAANLAYEAEKASKGPKGSRRQYLSRCASALDNYGIRPEVDEGKNAFFARLARAELGLTDDATDEALEDAESEKRESAKMANPWGSLSKDRKAAVNDLILQMQMTADFDRTLASASVHVAGIVKADNAAAAAERLARATATTTKIARAKPQSGRKVANAA